MISHPENSFSSGFAPFHHLSRQIDRPQYIAPYYRLRLASLGVLPYADPLASTLSHYCIESLLPGRVETIQHARCGE